MRWIRHKLPWILGLLILTGSLLGANRYAIPRNADSSGRDKGAVTAGNRSHDKLSGVVCQGLCSPENDIIPLAPSVTGEVAEVFVRSEQVVKKGDPLLRLDPSLAQDRVEEADAAVMIAEAAVREAKIGGERVKMEKLGQQLKINGKRREYEANKARLARLEKLVGITATKDEVEAARKLLEAQEILIEAEELVLKGFDIAMPDYKVTQAEGNLKMAKAKRSQAQRGVDACVMKAPSDGTIMRVFVGVGSKFGQQIQQPAFLFYTGGLIVRAEVDQEYASRVADGMPAIVYDYANSNISWRGRVTYVANSYQPRRDAAMLPDLLQQNQDRMLECRITLDPGQPLPRLNQKVRIHIGTAN